jgi:hypothetical protein
MTDKPTRFNRTKYAVQAFLKATVGRRDSVYLDITDIPKLKERKDPGNPFTPDELAPHEADAAALRRHGVDNGPNRHGAWGILGDVECRGRSGAHRVCAEVSVVSVAEEVKATVSLLDDTITVAGDARRTQERHDGLRGEEYRCRGSGSRWGGAGGCVAGVAHAGGAGGD